MPLDTAEKQKLIDSHQIHGTDTGSVEIQIAMLSESIATCISTEPVSVGCI